MDVLTLARLQFAVTTVYHFFFVPLTLGLSIYVAILETLYVRTRDEKYKQMTQFWGKLFVINFAMGVVTGIVQEFQFGLNWSEYSRFVGDIFGAPLAIEALLAFFVESTFLGLWIFGWDKLPRGVHAATIWLVAFGSNLSAFWILAANSFMQQPVGYVLRNGRAEMTDFLALITNEHVLLQFPHVLLSGVATAGFFVLGISAYHLFRRDSDHEAFGRAFRIAAVYALVGSILVIPIGHLQGQELVRTQPMKMAAAEALWDTENPAALSLFTIGDESNRRDIWSIRVSPILTYMAYGTTEGAVPGINNLEAQYQKQFGPGDYVPSVFLLYWSFRAMVGAGFLMVALGALSIYLWRTGRLRRYSWLPKVLGLAILLPYGANTAGWLVAELGRQPWIVYGLMRTDQAVSPTVPAWMVLISLVGFAVVYGVLMVADVYLLFRFARGEKAPAEEHVPLPAF